MVFDFGNCKIFCLIHRTCTSPHKSQNWKSLQEPRLRRFLFLKVEWTLQTKTTKELRLLFCPFYPLHLFYHFNFPSSQSDKALIPLIKLLFSLPCIAIKVWMNLNCSAVRNHLWTFFYSFLLSQLNFQEYWLELSKPEFSILHKHSFLKGESVNMALMKYSTCKENNWKDIDWKNM